MTHDPSESQRTGEVTRALRQAGGTPGELLDQVLPLVYQELRGLAARSLFAASTPSVQPTDLVHEAYLRLVKQREGWADRGNLMVAASVAMRRALVDHIRRRRSAKRGGDLQRTDGLEELAIEDRQFDALEVEDALRRLEAEDSAAAAVAELQLFGGLNHPECARALGVSTRTVERRWRFARAWFVTELGPQRNSSQEGGHRGGSR